MKIGFVDHFLDEYHANEYHRMLKEASGGQVVVAYAYATIDSPRGGMTTDKWCAVKNIQKVESIEELVEKSDGIVVLSPDNPEFHEDLCQLPLRSGKPVFVDKTFAETKASAVRLFDLADKHGTLCCSASALRFASEFCDLYRNRIQNKNQNHIENMNSRGPGDLKVYGVHQVEPIIMLMGTNVRRVMYTGNDKWLSYVIEFADGRRAGISHHGGGCPFSFLVDFNDSQAKVLDLSHDFFRAAIDDLVGFFLRGDISIPREETIATIAVIEAVNNAIKNPFKWTEISSQ